MASLCDNCIFNVILYGTDEPYCVSFSHRNPSLTECERHMNNEQAISKFAEKQKGRNKKMIDDISKAGIKEDGTYDDTKFIRDIDGFMGMRTIPADKEGYIVCKECREYTYLVETPYCSKLKKLKPHVKECEHFEWLTDNMVRISHDVCGKCKHSGTSRISCEFGTGRPLYSPHWCTCFELIESEDVPDACENEEIQVSLNVPYGLDRVIMDLENLNFDLIEQIAVLRALRKELKDR